MAMHRSGKFFAIIGWMFLCVSVIILALVALNINRASIHGLLAVIIGLLFSAIFLLTGLIADRDEWIADD